MAINFGDIASFATGVVDADSAATAERLVDRRAELQADREMHIAMKSKKYESELKAFEEEDKKFKAIQSVNAKFDGSKEKIAPSTYGKAYLMETNPTLLLEYEKLYKDNPNKLNEKLAVFGNDSVIEFKTSTSRETLDNKLESDIANITSKYKTQLEAARGDSKLIKAILGKRDSDIAVVVKENKDGENGTLAAKEIANETSNEEGKGFQLGKETLVAYKSKPPLPYETEFSKVYGAASFDSINGGDNLINFINASNNLGFTKELNFKFDEKDETIKGTTPSSQAFLNSYKLIYDNILNKNNASDLYNNVSKNKSDLITLIDGNAINRAVQNVIMTRQDSIPTGRGFDWETNSELITLLPLNVVDINNQIKKGDKIIDVDMGKSSEVYKTFLKEKAELLYPDSDLSELQKLSNIQQLIENGNQTLIKQLKSKLIALPVEDTSVEEKFGKTVAPDKTGSNSTNSSVKKTKITYTKRKEKGKEGLSVNNGKFRSWEELEKSNLITALPPEQQDQYKEWKALQVPTRTDDNDTVFSNMVEKIESDIQGS
jgi:hypothetical protein